MNILVCGGAGYIGSHTAVELLKAGHNVVCVDNLFNSSKIAIDRVEKITGKKVSFYNVDMVDRVALSKVFDKEKIEAVIMFAGYKAVGESVAKPLQYYYNNLVSVMNLIELMREHRVYNIIFSSSATVYGAVKTCPIKEDFPSNDINVITSPYGKTKAIIETMLMDVAKTDKNFKVVLLRYFNPVGADVSGLIGEDPQGIPNNLMPYIAQVAIGKREYVHVYGNDYKTIDGTGVRDYVHVTDLAIGHVLALKRFALDENISIYNLGTGKGRSVLEMIKAYERACGKKIDYKIEGRRAGDIDEMYCDTTKAEKELGFKALKDIDEMCASSYNFQKNNPNGYDDSTEKTKMIFEK